jgi:hypothetical protein
MVKELVYGPRQLRQVGSRRMPMQLKRVDRHGPSFNPERNTVVC